MSIASALGQQVIEERRKSAEEESKRIATEARQVEQEREKRAEALGKALAKAVKAGDLDAARKACQDYGIERPEDILKTVAEYESLYNLTQMQAMAVPLRKAACAAAENVEHVRQRAKEMIRDAEAIREHALKCVSTVGDLERRLYGAAQTEQAMLVKFDGGRPTLRGTTSPKPADEKSTEIHFDGSCIFTGGWLEIAGPFGRIFSAMVMGHAEREGVSEYAAGRQMVVWYPVLYARAQGEVATKLGKPLLPIPDRKDSVPDEYCAQYEKALKGESK